MKTQHTPSPWIHDDGHVFIGDKNRIYNSIATVHEIYTNDGKPEANAKLIAAAPELLDALQAALEFQNSIRDAGLFGDLQRQRRELRGKIETAIQKATS